MSVDSVQFVWLYVHDEAKGAELLYSIRSVYKYFYGKPRITVVGDKPDWYSGHYIDIPRIAEFRYPKFRSPLDQAHKLQTILQRDDIDQTFVLMMDDHYFLRGFDLDQLRVPRIAGGWVPRHRYWWDLSITLTMQALERSGLSTHLYETHLMHVFEKEKLQYIFDKFHLTTYPVLRNTLYGNIFRKKPKECRPFIAAPQSKQTVKQLDTIAKHSTVLNHPDFGWSSTLHNWLQTRFPQPTAVETWSAVIEPVAVST